MPAAVELSVVRSGTSCRLVIPKALAAELGWRAGDVLEFVVRAKCIEVMGVGRGGSYLRKRLTRFGGSYAVTLPVEVRSRISGDSVRVEVKNGGLVLYEV